MTTQLSTTDRAVPTTGPRRADSVSGSIGATLAREINATFAIAWRELLRAVKSPVSIAFTIIFPILFIGILGGSISQNLGAALPYAYLPFMLIGMIANSMYQGTISGITNLVEERENDFTAELFVAPISRYAVLLGKLIGSGIAALVSLVGIVAMVFVMQIPMDLGDLMRVVALTPVLALAGGSLGILFIGITQDPKVVSIGVPLLIFPQMFLSGALIPISASSGILGILAKVIPMTYSIDLARNIFYWGKPEYHAAVLHDPWLDLAITVGFFLVFTIVGTWLFVRADRNR
jgi:ABC-2 type transport system permease protein